MPQVAGAPRAPSPLPSSGRASADGSSGRVGESCCSSLHLLNLLLSGAGAAGEEEEDEQEAQPRICLLGNPGRAGGPLVPQFPASPGNSRTSCCG